MLCKTFVEQLKDMHVQAIPTGGMIAKGAYSSVIELKIVNSGAKVGGKVLQLPSISDLTHLMTKADMIIQELKTISSLRHENIVENKGVCFLPDRVLPVLLDLMETIMMTLLSYILHQENIPMIKKLNILCDTACGLEYLHSQNPAFVHGHLTAENILLDSDLRAKIAGFGNFQLDPESNTASLPGTIEYMPPEARGDKIASEPSVDVFSFGHLSLVTLLQKKLGKLLPSQYTSTTGELCVRLELDRRAQAVEDVQKLLSENPSLLAVIRQCLHNNPSQRPLTQTLLKTLNDACKFCWMYTHATTVKT